MKFRLPGFCKNRWFIFVLIIGLVFGAYFYWQGKNKKGSEIKTYSIQKMDLAEIVKASGKITARTQVSLKFKLPGRITWVGIKQGDYVQKWQGIASIDQIELQKSLQKYLLTYYSERMDFEQNKDNYKDTALTKEIERIFIKNQNDLDYSVLNVEVADLAKQYAYLYTPIEGLVIKATDEYAGVNSSATTEYVVIDPNSLRFSAEVEEADIGKINKSLPVTVVLDAFENDKVSSYIDSIDFTSVKTLSGNSAYLVHIPMQYNDKYRLDMNGDVEIKVLEKKQVLAVPISAVRDTQAGKVVISVSSDKKIKPIPVKTGIETDEFYEITEGLNEGDQICAESEAKSCQ